MTLSQKTLHKKGLVEWLKVKALSSNPVPQKKKKKNIYIYTHTYIFYLLLWREGDK
jgi:hypothetical protein